MSKYSNLWSAIGTDLAKHYGVTPESLNFDPDSFGTNNFLTHITQLILIELSLHEHRQRYSSPLFPLHGIDALDHMVFQKTKWKKTEINNLSTDEKLYVLLGDITLDHLKEEDRNYLAGKTAKISHLQEIDLKSYTGWQLGSGEKFLKSHL